jgi:hypothetical protein
MSRRGRGGGDLLPLPTVAWIILAAGVELGRISFHFGALAHLLDHHCLGAHADQVKAGMPTNVSSKSRNRANSMSASASATFDTR